MGNHTEPSQEALDLADQEWEAPIASSVQSEEATMLVLHTIGLANRAYLKLDGTGNVNLHFRGLRYGVDHYLPSCIFGHSISSSVTAGEFVCRQMLQRIGDREDEWPTLARQFLKNHTTYQPDRSQANR